MPHVLEQISIFSPLGIRFWDRVLDRPVTEGLHVAAYPPDQPWAARTAVLTQSGVYAFRGLAGLHDVEFPVPGVPAPDPRPFVVEVSDASGRYFPVAFSVELPLPERGIYPLPDDASPPEDEPRGFLLFAGAGRKPSAEHALLYASLEDEDGEAASFAVVLAALDDGAAWFGICDEGGNVAVPLPYPALTASLSGSPPAGEVDLDDQVWPVSVRVSFEPGTVDFSPRSGYPDLSSLFEQTQTEIIGAGGAPVSEINDEVRLGRPTILKTPGRSALVVRRPSDS